MYKRQEAGRDLEDFVQRVYSVMLSNEHLKYTKIEKNHIEIGRSGAKHEFDVFYEVKIAGVFHKVAIECKSLNRKIPKEMVGQFKSKLDDCNNITGFMVSAKGYQEGAEALGKYYGIELITIDDLPNVYQLLTSSTDGTLLDKNAHRDPVLGVMESKNKKNTHSYYSTYRLNKILNWIYNHPMKAIIEILIAVIAGVILKKLP